MLGWRLTQDIGPERLSMGRLQCEAAAARCDESDLHWNARMVDLVFDWITFRWSLKHCKSRMRDGFRTLGSHVFSGEEGVLSLAATPLS